MDPTNLEDQKKLIYATDEPDIGALIREYQKATPVYDRFHRILHSDDIRLNRWTNKSEDGKKYSSEDAKAFPFEGASDSENYLTDDTVNEITALLVVGFWRSVVERIHGVEAQDYEQAADFNRLLEWLMQTKLYRELVREVELSAQYLLTYGYVVLKVTWDRQIGRRMERVTMQGLGQLALAAPPDSDLRRLPELIYDPAGQEEAVAILGAQLRQFVGTYFQEVLGDYEEELLENYQVSDKRLNELVTDLRDKDTGRLPLPYFKKNEPSVVAMKIGEDCFVPNFMSSVQETTIFTREFMTEPMFRSKATLEGWDKEWVDKAAEKIGMQSTWSNDLSYDKVTDDAWEFTWLDQQTSGHDLIEVVTAYNWRLDEDGVAQRYYTIMHADIAENDLGDPLYAKHGLLDYDHQQMPFVMGMREWRSRNFNSSRGVALILRSRQRQLKTFYDGLIDYQSISVFPPLNVYDSGMGAEYLFGPAQKNPVTPGREPKFLDIPSKGAPIAFDLVETIRDDVDNAFGLMSPKVPPTRVQVKQQMIMNTFLMMWTEALQQSFGLVQQYLPQKDFQRITGSEKPLPQGTDISESKDFILSLDVRTLDMEHVLKEFKVIGESILPMDEEGVIGKGKLVKAMIRSINPSLAREVVLDKENASQVIKRKVQNDVMLMMGGFEPEYGQDADPAAAQKMQSLQEILQTNPRIPEMLGNPETGQGPGDPEFAQRFQKYVENIQFNIQQQQNKQIGRTGV